MAHWQRREDIFRLLRSYSGQWGYSSTMRESGTALDISSTSPVTDRPRYLMEGGGMAVVWLKGEDETTLKCVLDESEGMRLQPTNPYMAAWQVPAAAVEIQGKVVATICRP